jgi:rhodanese-related sulfurtransferase
VGEALIIVAAAALLGFGVNSLRPDGLPAAGAAAGTADGAITVDEALAHFESGDALFADARAPQDFSAGHIQGARSLPEHEFDAWIGEFLAGTPPEALIITYCDGAQCPLARSLAEKLSALGFSSARYMADGWEQWQARGLPRSTGSGD